MRLKLICALFLAGVAGCSMPVADDRAVGNEVPSEEELMAKWMEFMTPGEPHQMLTAKAGNWTMQSEVWTEPGAESANGTGSSTVRSIMEGRFIVEDVTGVMMGMPFEGLAIAGYDNMRKKFFSTWIDSMGTGMTTLEGTQTGNKIHYRGSSPDPFTDQYVSIRFVETHLDDDNVQLEMYAPGPDGEEFLSMRMLYTREGKTPATR